MLKYNSDILGLPQIFSVSHKIKKKMLGTAFHLSKDPSNVARLFQKQQLAYP